MLKAQIYNLEGAVIGEKELNPKIFGVPIKKEVIHQVVVAQLAQARQVLAHSKTKAEVRGGGRKPWRQKGTGRARHGSIRSPLWKGGGVTFGPSRERVFSKKINKKVRRKALAMCLSDRAANDRILLVADLKLTEIKTKRMAEFFSKLPSKGKSILLALDRNDSNIIRSVRNISKIMTISVDSLNVVDVIKYDYLLMPIEAVESLEKNFIKK